MILASAIKFNILQTGQDVVLCGARHADILRQLEPLGFSPRSGYVEIEQGFIDHCSNFLSREEALEHAHKCGQLSTKLYHRRIDGSEIGGKALVSEDLW